MQFKILLFINCFVCVFSYYFFSFSLRKQLKLYPWSKLYLSDLSFSKIRGVKFVLGRNMSEKEESEEATSQENEIEWGESFIGQDVCGSKYNDDPFDGMDNKRDAWTEMKKKIELKAKEKGKNIKDLEKGKWP